MSSDDEESPSAKRQKLVSSCPIGTLPDTDLTEVFKRLPPFDRLLTSEVCKRWLGISRSLWTDITHLDLRPIPGPNIAAVGKQCPNLRVVTALRKSFGTNELHILSHITCLSSVKLYDCTVDIQTRTGRVANPLLGMFSRNLRAAVWDELVLHELGLQFHGWSLGKMLTDFPAFFPASLRRLQLSGVRFSNGGRRFAEDEVPCLSGVGGLQNLECLILHSTFADQLIRGTLDQHGDGVLRSIASLKNLRELFLSEPCVPGLGIAMSRLAKLEVLFLHHLLGNVDDELASAIQSHPCLRILVLSGYWESDAIELPPRQSDAEDPLPELHVFLSRSAYRSLHFPVSLDAAKVVQITGLLPAFLEREDIKPIFDGVWIAEQLKMAAIPGPQYYHDGLWIEDVGAATVAAEDSAERTLEDAAVSAGLDMAQGATVRVSNATAAANSPDTAGKRRSRQEAPLAMDLSNEIIPQEEERPASTSHSLSNGPSAPPLKQDATPPLSNGPKSLYADLSSSDGESVEEEIIDYSRRSNVDETGIPIRAKQDSNSSSESPTNEVHMQENVAQPSLPATDHLTSVNVTNDNPVEQVAAGPPEGTSSVSENVLAISSDPFDGFEPFEVAAPVNAASPLEEDEFVHEVAEGVNHAETVFIPPIDYDPRNEGDLNEFTQPNRRKKRVRAPRSGDCQSCSANEQCEKHRSDLPAADGVPPRKSCRKSSEPRHNVEPNSEVEDLTALRVPDEVPDSLCLLSPDDLNLAAGIDSAMSSDRFQQSKKLGSFLLNTPTESPRHPPRFPDSEPNPGAIVLPVNFDDGDNEADDELSAIVMISDSQERMTETPPFTAQSDDVVSSEEPACDAQNTSKPSPVRRRTRRSICLSKRGAAKALPGAASGNAGGEGSSAFEVTNVVEPLPSIAEPSVTSSPRAKANSFGTSPGGSVSLERKLRSQQSHRDVIVRTSSGRKAVAKENRIELEPKAKRVRSSSYAALEFVSAIEEGRELDGGTANTSSSVAASLQYPPDPEAVDDSAWDDGSLQETPLLSKEPSVPLATNNSQSDEAESVPSAAFGGRGKTLRKRLAAEESCSNQDRVSKRVRSSRSAAREFVGAIEGIERAKQSAVKVVSGMAKKAKVATKKVAKKIVVFAGKARKPKGAKRPRGRPRGNFICKVKTCQHKFSTQQALDRHAPVHTGATPFSCPHCGREFTHESSRYSHIAVVHDKLLRFACENCHAEFGNRYNLNRHCLTCPATNKP